MRRSRVKKTLHPFSMFSQEVLTHLFAYIEDIQSREKDLLVKKDATEAERRIGALMTLTEEVGELAAEVRKQEKISFNQKKVDAANPQDLYLEAMDVLICTLLLLKKYHPGNLDEYMLAKIGKNQARGY